VITLKFSSPAVDVLPVDRKEDALTLTTYQQIRDALTCNVRPAFLAKQISLLTPAEQASLENLLSVQAGLISEVLKLLSTLPSPSPSSTDPVADGSIHEMGGFSLGDVVRSNDQHWLTAQEHLTGAIVRFEPVPVSQIPVVGSRYWAYLNSGAGPIGIGLLEKLCTDGQSLENLRSALGTSQKVEIITEAQPATAFSKTSKV